MAFSLITSGSAQEASGVYPSVTLNTTGADFLIIAAAAGGATFTPSDNKGNTFTSVLTITDFGVGQVRLWYCANANVGSNHTFDGTPIDGSMVVAAYSGGKYLSPLDGSPNGTTLSSSSTIQPGTSGTPSENNCLIVTALGSVPGPSATINSSFNVVSSVGGSSGNNTCSLAYKIQTTAGAENPTWTASSSGALQALIAVFKSEPFGRIVNETQTTTETRTLDGSTSKADTASVADEALPAGLAPTQADSSTAAESMSFDFSVVIAELNTASDTWAMSGATSNAQTSSASDIASGGFPLTTVTDAASVSEGQSFAIVANLADTASVVENRSLQGQTSKADTASAADNYTSQIGAIVDEVMTVSDEFTVGNFTTQVADTATVAEQFTQNVSLGKTYILTEPLPYGT